MLFFRLYKNGKIQNHVWLKQGVYQMIDNTRIRKPFLWLSFWWVTIFIDLDMQVFLSSGKGCYSMKKLIDNASRPEIIHKAFENNSSFHIHTYIYIYIYKLYIYICMYIYIYICICVCVCMYIINIISIYLSIYLSIYIYIYNIYI